MKGVLLVFKIILVLLVVVLGVGGVTFLVGSKPYEYTGETAINASPNDVFEHLTRPELLEQWLSGVASLTPIDEEGNPLVDEEGERVNVGNHLVGARAECVVDEDGNELTMITEVTESKWARALEVKITSPVFVVKSRYEITPVRNEEDPLTDNSEVRHILEVQYKSGGQLMAPFMSGATKTKLDEDLAALKEMVEDGTELAKAKEAPQRRPVQKPNPEAGGGGGGRGMAAPGPPPTKEELDKAKEKEEENED